jgi:hypothetical protein
MQGLMESMQIIVRRPAPDRRPGKILSGMASRLISQLNEKLAK